MFKWLLSKQAEDVHEKHIQMTESSSINICTLILIIVIFIDNDC